VEKFCRIAINQLRKNERKMQNPTLYLLSRELPEAKNEQEKDEVLGSVTCIGEIVGFRPYHSISGCMRIGKRGEETYLLF
jgi:hypothetical protein